MKFANDNENVLESRNIRSKKNITQKRKVNNAKMMVYLPESVHEDFESVCAGFGQTLSSRMRLLVMEDINKNYK